MVHGNYEPISYHFWDKLRFWSKIKFSYPCVFNAPDEVTLGIFECQLVSKTRVTGLPEGEKFDGIYDLGWTDGQKWYNNIVACWLTCNNKKLSWCWQTHATCLRGQSRSPNIVPFHMLGILSSCGIVTLSLSLKCHDLEIRVRGHSRSSLVTVSKFVAFESGIIW